VWRAPDAGDRTIERVLPSGGLSPAPVQLTESFRRRRRNRGACFDCLMTAGAVPVAGREAPLRMGDTVRKSLFGMAVSDRSQTCSALVATCALVALGACGGSDEPSAQDLLGTWNASFGPTWQIEQDQIAVTGGSAREIRYVATDTTIEVTDDTGCPTGTYEWEIDGDVLTFTVVDDEGCAGRRDDWNGATFDRVD
jgi:hypothetical protein